MSVVDPEFMNEVAAAAFDSNGGWEALDIAYELPTVEHPLGKDEREDPERVDGRLRHIYRERSDVLEALGDENYAMGRLPEDMYLDWLEDKILEHDTQEHVFPSTAAGARPPKPHTSAESATSNAILQETAAETPAVARREAGGMIAAARAKVENAIETFRELPEDTQKHLAKMAMLGTLLVAAPGVVALAPKSGRNKVPTEHLSPAQLKKLHEVEGLRPTTQLAKQFGLKPDQAIPRKLQQKAVTEGQHYVKAKAAVLTRGLHLRHSKKAGKIIHAVDMVALKSLNFAAQKGKTPQDVNVLSDKAVDLMMTAQNPQSVDSAPALKTPFQKQLSNVTMKMLFKADGGFSSKEARIVSGVMAKTIDNASEGLDKDQVLGVVGSELTEALQPTRGRGEHTTHMEAYKGPVDHLLRVLAYQESGGNPTQPGSAGDARGKYQYIDSTWHASAAAYYPPALRYARADYAPEAVQDAVAYLEYIHKYKSLNGNLFKLAVSHFYPKANLDRTYLDKVPPANVITPRTYGNQVVEKARTPGPWDKVQLHYLEAPDFAKYAAAQHVAAPGVKIDHGFVEYPSHPQTVRKLVHYSNYMFRKFGNRVLEPNLDNRGPVIQMITGGRVEKWCADTVSYIFMKIKHPFVGHGVLPDHRVPMVSDIKNWFSENGLLFNARSKIYSPEPGDVTMYSTEHTGIVVKASKRFKNKLKRWYISVEGNTSLGNLPNYDGVAINKKKVYYWRDAIKRGIVFGRDPK